MNKELRIKNLLMSWFAKNKKWQGFTLVELSIYMGIFVTLLLILTNLFSQVIDVQLESQATSSVEQDGRYILTKFLYDMNRASSITAPALGAAASTLQIVVSGVTYTYSIDGNNNLILTNNNGTDMLNGYDSSISNLSFQQIGNVGGKNTIQIQFRVTSKTTRPSGPEVRNYQTTAGIRY